MKTLRSAPKVPTERLNELGYAEYCAYLAAPHWQELRARLRREKPDRWRCEVCEDTAGLNVHHRSYRRFGCERLGDLIVLCGLHHEALHRAFWNARTDWTLWDFGRDWIDRERTALGLEPHH